MQSEEQRERTPSVWRRLARSVAWSLVTSLKVIFVLTVATLIIAGGYFLTETVVREYEDFRLRLVKLETDAAFALETNGTQAEALAALEDENARLRVELAAVEQRARFPAEPAG